VGAQAAFVDGSDIIYPAPGGGLLRVPVGGGPASQVLGSANGQLVFWDAGAAQWVVSAGTALDGQSPIFNVVANTWNYAPANIPAGTVPGAVIGAPGSNLNSGFLRRRGFVNAASSRIGTTFAGCVLEAATTLVTAADLGPGNWFVVDVAGSAGGGAGANFFGDGQCGPGGGGGARRRAIFTRAELLAMLPIPISAFLGGIAGIGRTTSNNVQTVAPTAGGNGGSAAFGRFTAGGGSGGSIGSTGRHAGTGGGLLDAPTPPNTTAAILGGPPAATIGAAGLFLEGAGHGATNTTAAFPGVPAIYGGASGGSADSTEAAGDGGTSLYGGGGGGGGRSTDATVGTGGTGGRGGGRRTAANPTTGGGGLGGPGTNADNVKPPPGSPGADGDAECNGDGGGGGGSNDGNVTIWLAGDGGDGGFPGGGGGGGGATRIAIFAGRTCVGGNGGRGADALVLLTGMA
jgi:hypothetical protein